MAERCGWSRRKVSLAKQALSMNTARGRLVGCADRRCIAVVLMVDGKYADHAPDESHVDGTTTAADIAARWHAEEHTMTELTLEDIAAATWPDDPADERKGPADKPDVLAKVDGGTGRTLVTRWHLGEIRPGVTAAAELHVSHFGPPTRAYVANLYTVALENDHGMAITSLNLMDNLRVHVAKTARFNASQLRAVHDAVLAILADSTDKPEVMAYFDPARAPQH